jgi:hypothetical protein
MQIIKSHQKSGIVTRTNMAGIRGAKIKSDISRSRERNQSQEKHLTLSKWTRRHHEKNPQTQI